jgi:tagatose-1,6-bisphosphate aldolase
MERALRRVFLSTTVLSRIVIVSKAAATNIVVLVYVVNRYICIAKEQVELFRKIGAVCANNKEEFILVITFDQERKENIEDFFNRNAVGIEDNSEGAEFGD